MPLRICQRCKQIYSNTPEQNREDLLAFSYCSNCIPEIHRFINLNDSIKNTKLFNKYKGASIKDATLFRVIRNRIVSFLKSNKKYIYDINSLGYSIDEILGCSVKEWKGYLEASFTLDMTWKNHGSYWHIDHIIPCASWDASSELDLRRCFNYRNTRPLEAKENIRRSNKLQGTQLEIDTYIYLMSEI